MRERVWVLSLFVVAADRRNTGWEKNLLERALAYGDGCERATIASSRHPAAMRGCARAGFEQGLDLAAGRGPWDPRRPTRPGPGAHARDCLPPARRGASAGQRVAAERNGFPATVSATRPKVARDLLWAYPERTPPSENAEVDWITTQQNWAVCR
ncbi:MAG: hypothetical protein AVDCRST_MAG55-2914 [uncultured Rubrobacteraceae bacterium]|uniref:Uncharacterized protein n=1 Tax=uncultured Rubrobacteraceae bacterium TaxID=349277 RepID=A0A6J4Q8B7_9ACTN|nr:MAG: hypothetical protein AVDCRST_MAG55-2914 [uncultured Rubrobacteraceae bacterium]